MQLEEWKSIPDFPGYEASSLGRIKRLDRGYGNYRGDRIVAPDYDGRGVWVRKDGKSKHFSIAYLVLLAFEGPPPGHYGKFRGDIVARHLDDDFLNNLPSNLAWGTAVDNMADAYRNGGRPRTWKHSEASKRKMSEVQKGHKLTPEQIAKMAASLRGRKLPKEVCQKISRANKGKKRTEVTKKRMSAAAVEGWKKRKARFG